MPFKFARLSVLALKHISPVLARPMISRLDKPGIFKNNLLAVTRWQSMLPAFESVFERQNSHDGAWIIASTSTAADAGLDADLVGNVTKPSNGMSLAAGNETVYVNHHHSAVTYNDITNHPLIYNVYAMLQALHGDKTSKIDSKAVRFQWQGLPQAIALKSVEKASQPVLQVSKTLSSYLTHKLVFEVLPAKKVAFSLAILSSNHQQHDAVIKNHSISRVWQKQTEVLQKTKPHRHKGEGFSLSLPTEYSHRVATADGRVDFRWPGLPQAVALKSVEKASQTEVLVASKLSTYFTHKLAFDALLAKKVVSGLAILTPSHQQHDAVIKNHSINRVWQKQIEVLQKTKLHRHKGEGFSLSLPAEYSHRNATVGETVRFQWQGLPQATAFQFVEKAYQPVLSIWSPNYPRDFASIKQDKVWPRWKMQSIRCEKDPHVFFKGVSYKFNRFSLDKGKRFNKKQGDQGVAEQVINEQGKYLHFAQEKRLVGQNSRPLTAKSMDTNLPTSPLSKSIFASKIVVQAIEFYPVPRVKQRLQAKKVLQPISSPKAPVHHQVILDQKNKPLLLQRTGAHFHSRGPKDIFQVNLGQAYQDYFNTAVDHSLSVWLKAKWPAVVTSHRPSKHWPLQSSSSWLGRQLGLNVKHSSLGVSMNRQHGSVFAHKGFAHQGVTLMQALPVAILSDEVLQKQHNPWIHAKVTPSYLTGEGEPAHTLADLKKEVMTLKQTLLQWQEALRTQQEQSQQQFQQQHQVLVSSLLQAQQAQFAKPIAQRQVHAPSFFDPL